MKKSQQIEELKALLAEAVMRLSACEDQIDQEFGVPGDPPDLAYGYFMARCERALVR